MPLFATEVLFLDLLLDLSLSAHHQGVVFNFYLKVLFFHAGDLNLESEFMGIFIDVHGRRKSPRFFSFDGERPAAAEELVEQPVHSVLNGSKFVEWLPPDQRL